MSLQYEISNEIASRCPGLRVSVIECDIQNLPTSDALWAELETEAQRLRDALPKMEMVNKQPAIAATRAAYKACGKDPNRYRPSAEALTRRIVKGMELYRSNAVVDLINLLSVATGHSIGGFDGDKIDGETLTLGIGREGEPYEAIGRGPLNIAGLPVWRDNIGGIGTPTSDNVRTCLEPETTRLVMIINRYGEGDTDPVALAERLLKQYAATKNFRLIELTAGGKEEAK